VLHIGGLATTAEAVTPTPGNIDRIACNSGATSLLHRADEWHHATCQKKDGVTGNYWEYPTGSELRPASAAQAFVGGAAIGRVDFSVPSAEYALLFSGSSTREATT
jgi:hypothetical protein